MDRTGRGRARPLQVERGRRRDPHELGERHVCGLLDGDAIADIDPVDEGPDPPAPRAAGLGEAREVEVGRDVGGRLVGLAEPGVDDDTAGLRRGVAGSELARVDVEVEPDRILDQLARAAREREPGKLIRSWDARGWRAGVGSVDGRRKRVPELLGRQAQGHRVVAPPRPAGEADRRAVRRRSGRRATGEVSVLARVRDLPMRRGAAAVVVGEVARQILDLGRAPDRPIRCRAPKLRQDRSGRSRRPCERELGPGVRDPSDGARHVLHPGGVDAADGAVAVRSCGRR
jgi:hypothetical protein